MGVNPRSIIYQSQVFENNVQVQNLRNIIYINIVEMDANCLKIFKQFLLCYLKLFEYQFLIFLVIFKVNLRFVLFQD